VVDSISFDGANATGTLPTFANGEVRPTNLRPSKVGAHRLKGRKLVVKVRFEM
jgi:hypothetical protein